MSEKSQIESYQVQQQAAQANNIFDKALEAAEGMMGMLMSCVERFAGAATGGALEATKYTVEAVGNGATIGLAALDDTLADVMANAPVMDFNSNDNARSDSQQVALEAELGDLVPSYTPTTAAARSADGPSMMA